MADFSKLNINDNTYNVKDSAARASITALQSEMPDKEDVSNKVTSMSAASTDTEYPSAKCVYDVIQANSGLFMEINYGATSDAIDAILAAGKYPYLYYGSRLYIYTSSTTYYHMFTAFTEVGTVIWYGINVLRSSSAYSQVIISQSNAVDRSSTNSQIPSAKAVYDFVINNAQEKLYKHHITMNISGGTLAAGITFEIINTHAEAYTIADKSTIGADLNAHSVAVDGNFDDTNANFCYATTATFTSSSVKVNGYISSSKLCASYTYYFNDIVTLTDTVGW